VVHCWAALPRISHRKADALVGVTVNRLSELKRLGSRGDPGGFRTCLSPGVRQVVVLHRRFEPERRQSAGRGA